MRPIKFKGIEVRTPRYDPHPEKSTTNNSAWRQGLFIIFEDYNGNVFDWMPKNSEIQIINYEKEKIESLNKKLCKENSNGAGKTI
jgi:hypothetical protein